MSTETARLLGRVLQRDGATYRVLVATTEYRAVLRGRVKRDAEKLVAGDIVELEPETGGELLAIAGVEPRRSLLERRVPDGRGTRPVAANVDEVFVATSIRDPAPVPQLLDRLLVLAEVSSIPAALVINKVDIAPAHSLVERFRLTGYPIYQTSAATGAGVDAFGEALRRHTSVVTGASGVGKSSLLNAVQPGLGLRVGAISEKSRRGRHTTVSAVMIPLARGGFLVDTPGFSDVGLWGVDARELASCFPEMRPFIGTCRFNDCRHQHEPGCQVLDAVARGEILTDRLQSYHLLLAELRAEPEAWE
ncbi:MAG TPA: ribosome small subunit-dependent GTPase A [Gemmatimonadales bacterium]|nr:ribosome small subunit-dependent GTPase A [Gemmatimonadales bacterium]